MYVDLHGDRLIRAIGIINVSIFSTIIILNGEIAKGIMLFIVLILVNEFFITIRDLGYLDDVLNRWGKNGYKVNYNNIEKLIQKFRLFMILFFNIIIIFMSAMSLFSANTD